MLRVREAAGVVPDLVVGRSVGAQIGAFWATGMSAAEIDPISFDGGPLTVFDPSLFADRGWLHGQKLQDDVNRGVDGRHSEEFRRRVIVAATRRNDGAGCCFVSGNTAVAVRASGAMPGLNSPVGIDGVEYEDGDSDYWAGPWPGLARGAPISSTRALAARRTRSKGCRRFWASSKARPRPRPSRALGKVPGQEVERGAHPRAALYLAVHHQPHGQLR